MLETFPSWLVKEKRTGETKEEGRKEGRKERKGGEDSSSTEDRNQAKPEARLADNGSAVKRREKDKIGMTRAEKLDDSGGSREREAGSH